MLDEETQEEIIRIATMHLMLVLYREGISKIHMGGLMRILGIPNETAAEHDDEEVMMDEEFAKYVERITEFAKTTPVNQNLH
jgi:hypothetical protein